MVKRANQSQFGLAAGIWAKDIDVVNTVSRGLHAGTVWVRTLPQGLINPHERLADDHDFLYWSRNRFFVQTNGQSLPRMGDLGWTYPVRYKVLVTLLWLFQSYLVWYRASPFYR